jgi:hypothetical protein
MSQTKNMGYDHPAYLARLGHAFPALAAGASGVTSKFVAFANLQIYGIQAAVVAVGSSTYTAWNGTATTTGILSDQVQLIRIMNNAAPGVAPSMSTATYGPFTIGPYNGTSTGTQTNAVGVTSYISLYGTGTTGQLQAGTNSGTGGISVNAGDQLYILRGTDASAVTGLALDYGVTPLASVGV